MKLTTARLKKLIREEMEKLNEAVSPKSFVIIWYYKISC